MASINTKIKPNLESISLSSYELLRRSVMCNLLWEDNFYENGVDNVSRIRKYMNDVTKEEATKVVEEAKFQNKLRHTPLFLMVLMCKRGMLDSSLCEKIITRVDDMTELLALYNNEEDNNLSMIPHSLSKGISKAFKKFDEYQLAKYEGKNKKYSLKDVIRLTHPKPENKEQEDLYKRVVEGKLKTPETWEVELSKSKDKKQSWLRLLTQKTEDGLPKLGSLALLRNLRNIIKSGVDFDIIKNAIKEMNVKNLLPFQFITSQRMINNFTRELEAKFLEITKSMDKMEGSTIILIDKSESMSSALSSHSQTKRIDVAKGIGAIAREICEDPIIYSFTNEATLIPSHLRGFALCNEIRADGLTAVISSTNYAISRYKKEHNGRYPKRVIVITDEQTNSDSVDIFGKKDTLVKLPKCTNGYIINVGTYKTSINYEREDNWKTISGWSENVLKYISLVEKEKW